MSGSLGAAHNYKEEKGRILGSRPFARSGHQSLIIDNMNILVGGDRYKMTFTDIYECSLEAIIKKIKGWSD